MFISILISKGGMLKPLVIFGTRGQKFNIKQLQKLYLASNLLRSKTASATIAHIGHLSVSFVGDLNSENTHFINELKERVYALCYAPRSLSTMIPENLGNSPQTSLYDFP